MPDAIALRVQALSFAGSFDHPDRVLAFLLTGDPDDRLLPADTREPGLRLELLRLSHETLVRAGLLGTSKDAVVVAQELIAWATAPVLLSVPRHYAVELVEPALIGTLSLREAAQEHGSRTIPVRNRPACRYVTSVPEDAL